MDSTCPRCGASMGEKQQASNVVMGMSVKGCSKCGGFLIDYSEAEEVLGKAVAAPGTPVKSEELSREAKEPLGGSCPFCGGAFIPSPLKFELSKSTLFIDQCGKCQGIWFDKGELSQIFQFAMKEAIAVGDLDENLDESLSKSLTKLSCPRCVKETDFSEGELLGIKVHRCKECRGLWLASGEMEELMGDISHEAVEPGEKLALLEKSASTPAVGGCPRCKVPLERWKNLPPALKDLYIDFCPTCMGLWFDKGEFSALMRIFSESPFVNA
ncbi:MAG: zf-TFIIB domain-containing protein [Candidatus Eremiobacteraeota bacterium]|nr:zf-TFIIB domain-containing protein [Candidatus Eremiobacteraeota bacterium]